MRYDFQILTYSFIFIFLPILDCGTSSGMGGYNRKSGKTFCNFKSLGAEITQNYFFHKKKCGKAELDFLLIDEIQDLRKPHMSWVIITTPMCTRMEPKCEEQSKIWQHTHSTG